MRKELPPAKHGGMPVVKRQVVIEINAFLSQDVFDQKDQEVDNQQIFHNRGQLLHTSGPEFSHCAKLYK